MDNRRSHRVLRTALGSPNRIRCGGGTPALLTTPGIDDFDIAHRYPLVLPGGDAVLFTSAGGTASAHRVAVASLSTGEWKVIADGFAARYATTGHVLFVRPDGSLWASAFDVGQLEVAGEPAVVLDHTVGIYGGEDAHYAVSDNGTLVFLPVGRAGQLNLVWVDRDGVVTPLSPQQEAYMHPRISPDGRRVAVTINEASRGRESIWILDLDRGTRTRLTIEDDLNRWPVWTHDGSRIVFSSGAAFDLFWMPVDGSGVPQSLLETEHLKIPISWARDLQTLTYYEYEMASTANIWVLPHDSTPSRFVESPFHDRAPMFSPDGRWMAYVSNESGSNEVYVRPYPGPGSRMMISAGGGVEPQWSRDGRELYYRRQDQMLAVSIGPGATLAPGAQRVLFTGPYLLGSAGQGNPNYDVSPDGRFLMVRSNETAPVSRQLHVVLNWFEELRSRVGN